MNDEAGTARDFKARMSSFMAGVHILVHAFSKVNPFREHLARGERGWGEVGGMLRGYLSRRESQANLLGDCHSVCPEFGSSLDQSRGVDDGRVVEATKLPAHPGPTCALVVATNEPPSDGTRARHRIHPRVGLELGQRQAIVARGLIGNLRKI